MKILLSLALLFSSISVFAADCSFGVYNGSTTPVVEAELKGVNGEMAVGDFTITVTERAGAMLSVEIKDNTTGMSAWGLSHQGSPKALDVNLTSPKYSAVISCTL